MDNINRVIIQGNLTKSPECKDVGEARLCKVSLASNREYKGEKETCFVETYCWGGLNKVIEKYLTKGSPVLIEGRLKLDSWTSKEGENRHKHVIIIEQLVMLPSNKKSQDSQSRDSQNQENDSLF